MPNLKRNTRRRKKKRRSVRQRTAQTATPVIAYQRRKRKLQRFDGSSCVHLDTMYIALFVCSTQIFLVRLAEISKIV